MCVHVSTHVWVHWCVHEYVEVTSVFLLSAQSLPVLAPLTRWLSPGTHHLSSRVCLPGFRMGSEDPNSGSRAHAASASPSEASVQSYTFVFNMEMTRKVVDKQIRYIVFLFLPFLPFIVFICQLVL